VLQEKEGLRLANKLTALHVQFRYQKIKVRLAAQLLSSSVADALDLCEKEEFEALAGCQEIVTFLRNFNNYFDMLNSKSMRQYGRKKPINHRNCSEIKREVQMAVQYIESLKCGENGPLIITSKRKTGFIGFIICLKYLLLLFKRLCMVPQAPMLFLPAYKSSQGHLELYFASIRSRGGHNNNPTASQFVSAYKKTLLHMELKADRTGNCIPLQQISIMTVSSAAKINFTTVKDAMVEFAELNVREGWEEHDYAESLPNRLTQYSEEVVRHIAGFVTRSFSANRKCAQCFRALRALSDTVRSKLTELKDRGGLVYPSDDVVQICMIAERTIKIAINSSSSSILHGKYTLETLTGAVLKNLVGTWKVHLCNFVTAQHGSIPDL